MQDMFINLLTRDPLSSEATGRTILESLSMLSPELTPEKYGNYEPLKTSLRAKICNPFWRTGAIPFCGSEARQAHPEACGWPRDPDRRTAG